MSSRGGARPIHDRPSLVTYAQIGIYGWMLYAFGPSAVLMRDDYGTTSGAAALYGTAFAIAGILVSLSGPRLSARWGRGHSLRVGGVAVTVGVLVYISGLPLPITYLGAFIVGLGGGLVMVFTNAQLNAHQGAAAPAALAEAGTLAALSGITAPLVIGLGIALGWGWRPSLVIAAVAFLALELFRGPLAAYDDHEDAPPPPVGRVHLPARYWWACVSFSLLAATEFCLMFWSTDLLRVHTGASAGIAAISVTAVVGGMAVGRAVGSVLARRASPELLLRGAIALSLAGVIATWYVTSTALTFVFLFVTGCGIALQWPLGVARTVRASDHHPDRAVSYALASVGVATATMPFLLGSVADQVGVTTAYLIIPAMLAVALVLVSLLRVDDAIADPVPALIPPLIPPVH